MNLIVEVLFWIGVMFFEFCLAAGICILLLIYLAYTILHPEKF